MEPWKPQAGLPAVRKCEGGQWGQPALEQQMAQPWGHCPRGTEEGMALLTCSLHCMQSSAVLLMEGGIFADWLICTGLLDPHRPRAPLIVWFCEFKETV